MIDDSNERKFQQSESRHDWSEVGKSLLKVVSILSSCKRTIKSTYKGVSKCIQKKTVSKKRNQKFFFHHSHVHKNVFEKINEQ